MDTDAIGFPIYSDLSYDQIRELAGSGTAKDVENMLRTSGGKMCEYYETGWGASVIPLHKKCLDAILEGIKHDGDDARRADKRSLVVDYNSSSGVFKKPEVDVMDVTQEFRDTIKELTTQIRAMAQTVAEGTQEYRESVAAQANKLAKTAEKLSKATLKASR
jgi:hypothetical protein